MATPINSKSQQTNASGTLGADLLARLQANAQGETASNGAFNAWMSKHAMSAEQLQAQPEARQAAKAPQPQTQAAPARDPNSTASKLLEQAINRARQQGLAANRQAEMAAQSAQTAPKPAAAPKGKADAKDDDTASQDEGDGVKSTAQAKTAGADEAAVVEELTPPPEVKTDDAQAMMAWLASLTHGDMGRGLKPAAKAASGSEGTSGSDAGGGSTASAAALDPRTNPDNTQAQGPTALQVADASTWQASVSTTALLQAEGGSAFKDELSARIEAKGADALPGAMAWRAQPELKGADFARPEVATLQAPVGSDAFAQALGDQLTMWVKNLPDDGAMSAELHLNPVELGPIHVKISLEGKDAQVDFAAAAVETRQAIEASMNALSTAFQDAGLNLTGGGVSAQTAQQSFQQAFGQGDQRGGGADNGAAGQRAGSPAEGDLGAARAVAAPRPGRPGGLDLYA